MNTVVTKTRAYIAKECGVQGYYQRSVRLRFTAVRKQVSIDDNIQVQALRSNW